MATAIGLNRCALIAFAERRPGTASGRKATNRLSTEALRGTLARETAHHTGDLRPVFPADGEDGAGLDDDLEQLAALVVEVEQVAGEDQVAGRRSAGIR